MSSYVLSCLATQWVPVNLPTQEFLRYTGKSLDLLLVLWGQFKLTSGLTPAWTFFQVHNCCQRLKSQIKLWGFRHVWMWELDCEEGSAPKNWCLWTVVLEKTLESPLDFKDIQQVHSEGDQRWDFFGRNDAKAETPVVWPPHAKSWLIGKDSDAGRGWGQEEKGMTEDEMAGWHHGLDGRES